MYIFKYPNSYICTYNSLNKRGSVRFAILTLRNNIKYNVECILIFKYHLIIYHGQIDVK